MLFSSVAQFFGYMIDHIVAQVAQVRALFCLIVIAMSHVHVEWLSSTSPLTFISYLFISLIFLAFISCCFFTFYFFDVVDYNHGALPLMRWVTRTKRTLATAPNAPKFKDRSQEEIEWQEQCAREAVWKLAKSVLKLKEIKQSSILLTFENRCLLASNLKLDER